MDGGCVGSDCSRARMLPFLDIRVDRLTEYGTAERPRDWTAGTKEFLKTFVSRSTNGS
jgi:hypothetical protein